MRILYCALKYDYGIPGRGFSYEHENFYPTLSCMPNIEVVYFPFDEVLREVGRREMNVKLLESLDRCSPDLCFFVLFTDEISKETIQNITRQGKTITFNWFSDDHWRFKLYSKKWAHLFHWVSTTDSQAIEKYCSIGYDTVIKTQWACNSKSLREPGSQQLTYDVTFVGQPHSNRRKIVAGLKRLGIRIECWGKGWPNGRLDQEKMLDVYQASKISLNFAEPSVHLGLEPIAKIFLTRRANDHLRLNTVMEMVGQLKALLGPPRTQIKARDFEIPGCGGFLMTDASEEIQEFYTPGKEVIRFDGFDDLVDKIRYYLVHEEERERIRNAGFARTRRDHTFEQRFTEIFRVMGLV